MNEYTHNLCTGMVININSSTLNDDSYLTELKYTT